jgi:hypothetical protein
VLDLVGIRRRVSADMQDLGAEDPHHQVQCVMPSRLNVTYAVARQQTTVRTTTRMASSRLALGAPPGAVPHYGGAITGEHGLAVQAVLVLPWGP